MLYNVYAFHTKLRLFERKVFSPRNISMDGYVWNPENDGATGYGRCGVGVLLILETFSTFKGNTHFPP